MMIDPGPCVADAGVNFILSIQTNVFFWKIGSAGPGRARSPLAVVAMTDVDQGRLARDDDAKLTAKALGGSFHDSPSKFLIYGMGFIRSPLAEVALEHSSSLQDSIILVTQRFATLQEKPACGFHLRRDKSYLPSESGKKG